MDTRETPAAKAAEAATPQRQPRDICALATQRTFLTQEEMVLANAAYCYPKIEKSHVIHPASS